MLVLPWLSHAYSNDSLSVFLQRNRSVVTEGVLNTLVVESEKVLYENPRAARRHAEGILMLADNNDRFSLQIGLANKLKGEAFSLENDYELSLKSLEEAHAWFAAAGFSEELAQVQNLMGACYQGMGDTKMAIALVFQALKVLEQNGPDEYLASALETLGHLFGSQKKYEEAQDYYLKALGIRQSLSNTFALARTLLSIAKIEDELHNFQQARDYNVLALERMKAHGSSFYVARGLQQLGHVQASLGEVEEAISNLEKALGLYAKLGNTVELAYTKIYLAEVFLKQDKLRRAEVLTREAMGLAQDTDRKDVFLPIYKLWAEILSRKGMAQPAISWYQKAYELRDSLLRLEHMNHLTRVQASQALDAKDKENNKLKQQRVGYQRQIQSQKTTIFLFCFALLSILAMFLMALKSRMKLRKAYEIQALQKQEILLQATELKEANAYISTLNSQLEKQVERRSQLILEKNRKLEKYAYELSHSIRSPLSNVLGIIHLMKQGGEMAYLEKLEASARQLDDVVREANRSIEEGE